MKADHVLHIRPGWSGTRWRLECLSGDEHFIVDGLEEWHSTGAELEAAGFRIDRSKCWTQDWLDDVGEDCIVGDDWPEDGPWPVLCSFNGGAMDIEYAGPQEEQ